MSTSIEGLRGEIVSHPGQIEDGDELIAADTSSYPPEVLAFIAVGAITRFQSGTRYRPVEVAYVAEGAEKRQAYLPVDSGTVHLYNFDGGPGDGRGVVMSPQLAGVKFYRRTPEETATQ